VVENARERQRLRELVGRLTDEELQLPLGEGWTVAVALAHLAFWDQRALVLMRNWRSGAVAPGPSPIDEHVTNDALLPVLLEILPRMAASLAVDAAAAIDREIEEAPAELVASIQALGDRFRLYRADHRKAHLDQIESALRARTKPT
jgi:hypothetical protein